MPGERRARGALRQAAAPVAPGVKRDLVVKRLQRRSVQRLEHDRAFAQRGRIVERVGHDAVRRLGDARVEARAGLRQRDIGGARR